MGHPPSVGSSRIIVSEWIVEQIGWFVNGVRRLIVLETKGMHLSGNDDTTYKQRLFDLLSEHCSRSVEAGQMELEHDAQRLTFRMVFEETWRSEKLLLTSR
jgi:hypothetical protein